MAVLQELRQKMNSDRLREIKEEALWVWQYIRRYRGTVAVHILLLVPVVGITYEFNRYVGGHNNAVTRFLSKPGLWMQNFTTFEPDDSMLEVAIEALKLVLPEEKGADKW